MTNTSRNMLRRKSVGEYALYVATRLAQGLTFGVPDWSQKACSGTDASNFFPEGDGAYLAENRAKKVCGGCPIWQLCLAYEMQRQSRSPAKKTTFGIWGGSDPRQRNYALKAVGIIKPPAPAKPVQNV